MSVVMDSELIGEETSRYHTEIGLLDESTHYGRLAQMVGHGKQVLELGCSTGYFSGALSKQFGCTVTGVELDAKAAQEAKKYCHRVIEADLDNADVLQVFENQSFDVVVCSDVLEHLRNPGQLLVDLQRLLKPGGYIVASIPHVGHGSIRLSLLAGQFPYRRMGLLDDTHLRFFDRMELEQLFVKSGYELSEVHRNRWSIFDNEVGSRVGHYPTDVVTAIQSDPEAETYQFIVKAGLAGGKQSNAQTVSKTAVDFVVFQTPNQPLNDKVIAYLDGLDLSKMSVKFHLVRQESEMPESFDALPLEHFEFGNHDFTTFRFVPCGKSDMEGVLTISDKIPLPINKGAVLNKLIPECRGEFVFVTDTQNLPTTECLSLLVDYARSDAACGIAAASPEVYGVGQPYRVNGGSMAWAPLTCVLLRKTALEKLAGRINARLSNPAQEVDFCWQLWQSGWRTVQVDKARFFGFGISSWKDRTLALKQLQDAVWLRLAWGSLREVISFVKNSMLAAKDLSWAEKALLLFKVSGPALKERSARRPATDSSAVSGVIGFYGPGRCYCGSGGV